jgi:hypothetical protein
LQRRPSKNHYLYLFIPFDAASNKCGFFWVDNLNVAMDVMAPRHVRDYLSIMPFAQEDGSNRTVGAYYVKNSDPNVILGHLVAGRPTRRITGCFLMFADNTSSGWHAVRGDVLPADVHRALHHVAKLERPYGPVRIALTPEEESLYGEMLSEVSGEWRAGDTSDRAMGID